MAELVYLADVVTVIMCVFAVYIAVNILNLICKAFPSVLIKLLFIVCTAFAFCIFYPLIIDTYRMVNEWCFEVFGEIEVKQICDFFFGNRVNKEL